MTLPDLGPERPGQASDTRQMVEQDRARTADAVHVSNPVFAIAIAVIVALIVIVILLTR